MIILFCANNSTKRIRCYFQRYALYKFTFCLLFYLFTGSLQQVTMEIVSTFWEQGCDWSIICIRHDIGA